MDKNKFAGMSFKSLKKILKQNRDYDVSRYLGNLVHFDEKDEKQCELADKILKVNQHKVSFMVDFDFYQNPKHPEQWLECPKCGNKPKIWIFNNGCQTACSCANNRYDAFVIKIESIGEVLKRTGSVVEYRGEEGLMKAWNKYCKGE